MLIRQKLSASQFSNPALRYDETCNCVQFSPDGGATWIDQPANDPRTSDAYRLPALSGGDAQCRAAEGMRALVEQFVNERIGTDTAIELAGGILGIIAFIPGFNVLWALILAFASLAVTIARELLEAAFTEEIYEDIRCTFYCHIGGDGQMSQAQFDAAYAEFDDDSRYPNAITQLWVHAVMDLVGCVGLSDAGVSLEAAADCDECGCQWCYEFDFSLGELGWAAIGVTTYSSGAFHGAYNDANSQSWAYISIDFATTHIFSIEMTYCKTAGAGANNSVGTNVELSSSNVYSDFPSGGATIGCPAEQGFNGYSGDATKIFLNVNSGTVDGAVEIRKALVRGYGDCPFGEPNC